MKFEPNVWHKVSETGVPPYDELCVVKGLNKYNIPVYGIGFNECYRPNLNFTQVIQGEKTIYCQFPEEILEWMILPY